MTTLPPASPRLVGVLLGVVLAAACGSRVDRAPATPARDSLCATIDNAYECAQAVERERLARGDVNAERHGDTLVLAVADSAPVRLVDTNAGGQDNVFYSYRAHLPIGYYLVDIHYWEGGAYLLVSDRTGATTRVSGVPVVSPDGRRLVVVSAAGVAGYSPNELQVWQVTPDGLALEWEIQPDDWGATDARWVDPRTVRFQRSSQSCSDEPVCNEEAVLRFSDGTWTVDEGP